MINEPIYIVTSLPRTGTTSICEMASIVNLKPMHVLYTGFEEALSEGYNFFADTPFYSPEFLVGIAQFCKNLKFIYIERSVEDIKKSFVKRGIHEYFKQYSFEMKEKPFLHDALCYQQIHHSPNFFKNHKTYILNIAEAYDIDFLDYSFDKGWDVFCNFVNKKMKINIPIPHLNKIN